MLPPAIPAMKNSLTRFAKKVSPELPHMPFLPVSGSLFGIYQAAYGVEPSERRENGLSAPPFFRMLTEEGFATMFLKAVAADTETARAFVSKNCSIDLEALRDILTGDSPLPLVPLVAANKNSGSRARRADFCVTRSVFLTDPGCILHLHLIREPDSFGTWKIYGVEKE